MSLVEFLRNRWLRVALSSALRVWTLVTLSWILSADAPHYVLGHAVYDLIMEGVIALSLWMDVLFPRKEED